MFKFIFLIINKINQILPILRTFPLLSVTTYATLCRCAPPDKNWLPPGIFSLEWSILYFIVYTATIISLYNTLLNNITTRIRISMHLHIFFLQFGQGTFQTKNVISILNKCKAYLLFSKKYGIKRN